MSQNLALRTSERVPEDPLNFWLGRLDSDTQKANRSQFTRWMQWLNEQSGWENVTPRDLIVRQLEYVDKYVVLDLLQRYIKGLVLRKSSKRKTYSVVKSFFIHNRCALPPDPSFRIRGDKPPVQARLIPMDIADLTAIHRNTVSKYVYGLEKEGKITMSRQVGSAKLYTIKEARG